MNNFHVLSLHKDNFRVTLNKDGTLFLLQTHVNHTLLNATDRAKIKFDLSNWDTSNIILSIFQTVNVIAYDIGTDFHNMWLEGSEYELPFPCNPQPHVVLVWQFGCPALYAYRTDRTGIYPCKTLHQQIPHLYVIFTSQETQHVSGMKAKDVVINVSPTRNSRHAGNAPPPPPSAMRGGSGLGLGGYGGGLVGYDGGSGSHSFGGRGSSSGFGRGGGGCTRTPRQRTAAHSAG
jgi:hypothetical protein